MFDQFEAVLGGSIEQVLLTAYKKKHTVYREKDSAFRTLYL